MAKHPLASMQLESLQALLGSRSRAVATVKWFHGAGSLPRGWPDALPGVGRKAWERLQTLCELPQARVHARHASADGTVKLVVETGGVTVETVLIPAKGRSTVCVSSQAGCSRRCAFCATATLGLTRNLKADEIISQFLLARAEAPSDAPARNVVFMGMGEPMDNLDEVLVAVNVLTQSPAPQLRAESVTVSTSGILPGMQRFLRESRASLALSMNATTEAQRERLMPQTQRWPLAALLDCLRDDATRSPRRHHFIEYVLFDGVNDSEADADRLGRALKGVRARVNLIPHNPIPNEPFQPPSRAQVLAFQQRVMAQGLLCFVRWPRGDQVAAACGQLALTTRAG